MKLPHLSQPRQSANREAGISVLLPARVCACVCVWGGGVGVHACVYVHVRICVHACVHACVACLLVYTDLLIG